LGWPRFILERCLWEAEFLSQKGAPFCRKFCGVGGVGGPAKASYSGVRELAHVCWGTWGGREEKGGLCGFCRARHWSWVLSVCWVNRARAGLWQRKKQIEMVGMVRPPSWGTACWSLVTGPVTL
jgi:hypothetical protein